MSLRRAIVPPPEILTKQEVKSFITRSPNKISTVLTNVQRRNVPTVAPTVTKELTIFQMAAQGELLMLKNRLEQSNCMIDAQDSQGFTPLMWACANGQKAAVELLLYCGANPSISGDNGENGLLLASYRGHHDVVLYLLRAGLDVNSTDELNNTPLMFAAYHNHVAIVSLLLDWGADLTIENGDGWTTLEIAMRKNAKASQRVIEKHIVQLLQGKQ